MEPLQNKTERPLVPWLLLGLAASLSILSVMAAWQLTRPCPDRTDRRVWGTCYRELQARPLTIGVAIGAPDEDYTALAAYLKDKLGVPVTVNQDTPYEQLPNRMTRHDWDIAFTRSPIFSIIAEDNRYTGVAVMFPDRPPYYRAALYVRADSPIESIADINSTTTLALGNPESAPTFHMPIYVLYGKTLRVETGNRPREVVERVKSGEVDVGAGRFDAVKDDPAFRIIHVSRAIPGAGVYLSPALSKSDQKRITEALLTAPSEVRAKAHYGEGQIPKYGELRKITARTTQILNCPSLNSKSFNLNQPVGLFCKNQSQNTAGSQTRSHVVGQVSEYKLPSPDKVELKVITQAGEAYFISVSREILDEIPLNPASTVDQLIQLNAVEPRRLGEKTWEVEITQPSQLSQIQSQP